MSINKSCMICGTEEDLLATPCGTHWVCTEDVADFFESATRSESLFPPKCCGETLLLEDYEAHVPFEASWAYHVKQKGEYAIPPKNRVYCANSSCSKFLHPGSYAWDEESGTTYAICKGSEGCGKTTCVSCKRLLASGTKEHACRGAEEEREFRQAAKEQGFQECFGCSRTIELAEACNHITCECGAQFCYVCGNAWTGLHGCPQYGAAEYDDLGYNQDGFHRETGRNLAGLDRDGEI
ncbi:hypothetical protein P153DRAFT_312897, partial [Dothidotthia symphoricarpi CBS 119687]